MRRMISRNDFVEARQFGTDLNSSGDYYWVCEEYEVRKDVRSGENSLESYSIQPRYDDLREEDKWRIYKPLAVVCC